MSSPKIKNISLYQNIDSAYMSRIPSRSEGRRPSYQRGTGRGGRCACARRTRAERTAKACGPDVAVLASIDGGKRAVLRGEHVISRKAIAQGMSDVLRCPCMLMRTLFRVDRA